jgi:oxaloacetate decarboxylase beta subunit
MELLNSIWINTGLYQLTWGQGIMLLVGILLLFLAIVKKFEPLLLLPIGFGTILSNIPGANLAVDSGILHIFYQVGIESGAFPLIIFMGVGALTDFGPLLSNPKTLLLGAAAQFGIFTTLLGAVFLTAVGVFDFSLQDAAAIGIIGGADGPTSIYVASKLSPELLGAIAVASYSYMALVPLIQPPIMRALTTKKERQIEMVQLRHVSKTEKIVFPIMFLILIALLLPDAAPLLGMFAFGNLMKESGVVDRLSDTVQNALINIVTIFLGLAVGSKLMADSFLRFDTRNVCICNWYCLWLAYGKNY